jgi:beta-glucosidase
MTISKPMRRNTLAWAAAALGLLTACATPAQQLSRALDAPSVPGTGTDSSAITETRIDALLAAMTVEQKVGQVIMPDISAITPDDMRRYGFGSILNGGNSGPGGNERAPAAEWLALADAYWDASISPRADGGPVIPALWATDAVHGHSNVVGATLFPHNIGLGASGNAELVRRIGEVTAAEIAVTGIDWTFAPTIAVARDDRWGRTYESYGEDPELVSRLGAPMVEGLQGRLGTADFLGQHHVLATAKHFFGDGGTNGRDQGNTTGDEAALIALHAAPYPPAIEAGAQTVMASFSSINGAKMHGSRPFLTGLLRDRMGFDGLVVGDWNGHGQVPGCSNSNCPQALLAGLDIYMVPEEWRALHATLMTQVADGTIPMPQLDQAVRRILRVKLRMGLFDRGRPSTRPLAMRPQLLGAPEHRAVARQAVRESLVLLTNRNNLLPLNPRARIMVAGPGADDIAMQSGGWTISWQGGGDLTNADFPGAQSIYGGIAEQVARAGGQAILSPDGSYSARPDAAVVVFGERPYAEFTGDLSGLQFSDPAPLALMRRLKAEGIPVVALFLSGRPMWVNAELNTADAFIAAWLPGSEGGGIADLLLRGAGGEVRNDFTGRLSMSWPARCDQFDNNAGAPGYAPLFPLGFGLSLNQPGDTANRLDEDCALLRQPADAVTAMRGGTAIPPFSISLESANGQKNPLAGQRGRSPDGLLTVTPRDRLAQEDARELVWTGPAAWVLATTSTTAPLPTLPVVTEGDSLIVEFDLSVVSRARGDVSIDCGPTCSQRVDLSEEFALAEGKGWRTMRVSARCLTENPSALPMMIRLQSAGPLTVQIAAVRIVSGPSTSSCVS